jgi:hypothetical protein
MMTLDLARAHIDELQRAAARDSRGLELRRLTSRLRRAAR